MGRIRCVVVGTLFALVVVVPPATAACMEQRDAARRWHEARPEGQRPPVVADQAYECWPDTVDPRGPKAGTR